MLIDSHAHIHFSEFENDLDEVFKQAHAAQVTKIVCVGTDDVDSKKALEFVVREDIKKLAGGIDLYATAGLHPHEAKHGEDALLSIKELVMNGGYGDKLVAVGECGLDYYRNLSTQPEQIKALKFQIELALAQGLPLVFHVRDAWEDFFTILGEYKNIRGVVHSFTGGPEEVKKVSEFGLYFGLNGIMTFTKEENQLEAAKLIPTNHLLLETDCPFLAPNPERGHRNEPAYLRYTAEFLAKLRGETLVELSEQSSQNAQTLFNLS